MTPKEIQAKRREWYRSAVDLLGWWLVRQMASAVDANAGVLKDDSLDVARMAGHFGRLASGHGDWQPIATAPKDGAAVLVWSAGVGLVGLCRYDGSDWELVGGGLYSRWAVEDDPTHWQALPEPPSQ